jgi:hypothetical protein
MIAAENQNNESAKDVLRETFVEMLFALAVGQIAVNVAAIVTIPEKFITKLPAFSHSGVALLLIATSWVGWRQSNSPGMKKLITSVFSMPFIGLLMDVVLVVLYFIVVQKVEVDLSATPPLLKAASVLPEAMGLMWVFGTYALWDLIADVLSENCIPKAIRFRLWKMFRAALVSMFTSLFCFGLVALVAWQGHEASVIGVVALDVALAATILLFRSAKGVENLLAPLLRVTDCSAFERPRAVTRAEHCGGVVCLALYALSFALGVALK